MAAMGLILSSCSKDDTTGTNPQNPNVIGFDGTTSRASINTIVNMSGDANGFKVYGSSGSTPSDWYTGIDGSNNYKCVSGVWGWNGTSPEWPTATTAYPMKFYAAYPAAPAGVTYTGTYPAVTGAVTIQSTAATQIDLLAAKNEATTQKPAGGKLPLTFNHILSKINFGVIPGYNATPYVMAIDIVNVGDNNTYDYVAGSWAAKTPAADAGYSYFKGVDSNIKAFTTGTDINEVTAQALYTGTHSNHLMLMPQNGRTAWDPENDENNTSNGAYIESIYRLESTADKNAIGWEFAKDYLTKYMGETINGWGSGGNTYTGIGTGAGEYNGPLFIKAGFPLSISSTGSKAWEAGKGYTYNLCLGTVNSSNGYYLDEYFYDQHGQKTSVPIKGNIGKPVTDGVIHFNVSVSTWTDEAGIPVED